MCTVGTSNSYKSFTITALDENKKIANIAVITPNEY